MNIKKYQKWVARWFFLLSNLKYQTCQSKCVYNAYASKDLCMSAPYETCIIEIISVFKKVSLHYRSCIKIFDKR